MIWVRKTQNENGDYVSEDGTRYIVEWCNKIYCPCGLTEEQHGYEKFDNLDAAKSQWKLEIYIDPEIERMLLEEQNLTNTIQND